MKVFLSYSSNDKKLALELTKQIEAEFGKNTVFVSLRPSAIPSGADWQDTILASLEKADVFVVLISQTAENSVWVGFELGYFWKRMNGKNIHSLFHPTAKVPSPLDTLQAKRVTDAAELEEFFKGLSQSLQIAYKGQADIDAIVGEGKRVFVKPEERTLAYFEYLLENSAWNHSVFNGQEVWICSSDSVYQIVIQDAERDLRNEVWLRKLPSPEGHLYNVILNVSGASIKETHFVSVDGDRYFVPLPEVISTVIDESSNNEHLQQKFIWKRSSLSFKLSKVISIFYSSFRTIEDLAQFCGIEIID